LPIGPYLKSSRQRIRWTREGICDPFNFVPSSYSGAAASSFSTLDDSLRGCRFDLCSNG
jgi:hypothetical protein